MSDNAPEIPSAAIGAKVMNKLHHIDPVAYVRYVSVYREFDDVGEFIAEIQNLSKQALRDPMQRELLPSKPAPKPKQGQAQKG